MTAEASAGPLSVASAAVPASAPQAPSPGAPARSTSWQLYAALALASLVLGTLSVLYPSTPSYDPWGWLLWGREILHGHLYTIGGNSFKPLPVIFTTIFAIFGRAQPDLWLAFARAGAIFTVGMAFKMTTRLTLALIDQHRGAAGGSAGAAGATGAGGAAGAARREWLLARLPALLAGAAAGVCVVIAAQYVRDAALGYSECLSAGMVLLAIDRHLDGKPRQTFVIGFVPALDRPEIWAFWGLYGVYLWFRDPGARKLVLALFVLIPILWFLPEYWGSGHFLRGVNRALHPRQNAATFTKCPFCTELKSAWHFSLSRMRLAGVVTALGAALVLALAARRLGGMRALVRERGRPEVVLLTMGVMAVVWFVEISAMTQYGFSGNQRYLIIGGALVIVLGGVGWGFAAWLVGALLGRVLGRTSGVALASLAATAIFLLFPQWFGSGYSLGKLNRALRYQAELRQDLPAIIKRAGGARKVVACGSIEVERFQKQMVAWYLDVNAVKTQGPSPDGLPGETAPRDPNVIFQDRDTGTAPLRPVIPKNVPYTRFRHRTFRLFEHCK